MSRDEEIQQLRRIHEKMEIGYVFPDLSSPLFVLRKTITDRNGQIIAAVAVKLVGEVFLWIDPDRTDRVKVESIEQLAKECREQAKKAGLEEVTAWIPVKIELMFAKLLSKLGFTRSPWASWSTKI